AFLVAGIGTSLGLLVAAAMSVRPYLGLLAVLPVAAADRVLRQYASGQRDRHRLDGLLTTALDTHASMGLRDVEAALLRNTKDLLNASDASLDPVPGPEGALSAPLVQEGRPMWLTVPPRHPAYDAQDQALLDGLAAIGATALENALLMAEVHREAFHDPLTGLANRTLFEDRCEHALAQARRSGTSLALLFVDLDRFKRVNDSLGHSAGDELLRQAGARIASVVRSVDTACRMGGDEFTVLLSGNSRSEAEAVIERLQATMAEPFTIEDQEVFVRANVGIAVYPDDGLDYRSLLQKADASMYLSKRRERDLPPPERHPASSLSLESQLHRAIERGELRVLYQPQMRISSRDVVGFEALVRWQHPALGMVAPGVFLPLAEESGVIADIDAWVLKTATWQLSQWARAGFALPTVAVNLSAALARSDHLESLTLETLRETRLDPSLLELEVTERVASDDDPKTLATCPVSGDPGSLSRDIADMTMENAHGPGWLCRQRGARRGPQRQR
ncbi:MAG: putative bifunctional diguanylate cyclase/phosphodiesterase, partial [Acidimicrobiia bacterium]